MSFRIKSINLTSSGMMGCYCAGILQYMVDYYKNKLDECLFTGSSSGALLATFYVAFDQSPKTIITNFTQYYLKNHKNSKFHVFYPQLTQLLIQYCNETFSSQKEEMLKKSNSGKLFIQYTQLLFRLKPWWNMIEFKGHLKNQFTSLDDLYETLAKSCNIPFKTCSWDTILNSGLDGGFSDRCPQLIQIKNENTEDDKKIIVRWANEFKTPFYLGMPKSNEETIKSFVICENRWRKFSLFDIMNISFDEKETK